MTVADTRAALVAALASVPQLSAGGHIPSTITAYSAWVSFLRTEPINYCVQEAFWFAIVALPAGMSAATVTAADELIEPVMAALKPLAKVQFVDLAWWPVEPGMAAIPVLRFSLEA